MSFLIAIDTKTVFRSVYLIAMFLMVILKINQIRVSRKKRCLSEAEQEAQMDRLYPLDENGKRPWEIEEDKKGEV